MNLGISSSRMTNQGVSFGNGPRDLEKLLGAMSKAAHNGSRRYDGVKAGRILDQFERESGETGSVGQTAIKLFSKLR